MTADQKAKSKWSRYGPVLQFLAKAVAIYGAWYVLYDLWLLPDGRLDAWVSQTVVHAGQMVLSGVGIEAVANRSIKLAQAPGIRIVDGCNGLSTIGLFAGFVLAFPGSTRRRLLFIPFRIGVIYQANVARVSLLAELSVLPLRALGHTLLATHGKRSQPCENRGCTHKCVRLCAVLSLHCYLAERAHVCRERTCITQS